MIGNPSRVARLSLLLILLALAGLASLSQQAQAQAQAQQPYASLDRSEVALGESVNLTIHLATASSPGDPDWTPLQQDFQLTHPRRSSRHTLRNGRAEASTEWQVTLLPRQAGTFTIPPLSVGGAQTQPLALRVLPGRPAASAGEPIFLETSVDRDSVYVEQQLLLTVRIHHAVPLDDMRLTEPEFDAATVHKVSQNSYSRDIDGTTYRVHELRYAIFPQEPGPLTIPELAFTATRLQRPRSLFDFPGQGQPVSQLSARTEISVRPIPPAFTGPVWLPARNLTLVESWSQSPQQLRVGESATRTLTLRADGQPADRLPPLPQPDLSPRARLYADQPQLDNQLDEQGVRGSRVDSAALIVSEPGPIELPGVRVIWWDVDSDEQRIAEIPTQRYEAAPAIGTRPTPAPAPGPTTQSPADTPAAGAQDAPGPGPAPATHDQAAVPDSHNQPWYGWLWQSWPWLAALALALLGWLLTFLRYRSLRRRVAAAPAALEGDNDEAARFHALLGHCEANRAEPARRALLSWARHFFDDSDLRSTRLLRARLHTDAARAALDDLDTALFGGGTAAWNGRALADSLARERKLVQSGTTRTQLPPLYPEPVDGSV